MKLVARVMDVMSHCGLMALYDKFDFTVNDITRFQTHFNYLVMDYIVNPEMYLHSELGSTAYKVVKTIPINSKRKVSGIKYSEASHEADIKAINESLSAYYILANLILLGEFGFKYAQIRAFNAQCKDYMDSYVRVQKGTKMPYLNNRMVNSIFKDELGLKLTDILYKFEKGA